MEHIFEPYLKELEDNYNVTVVKNEDGTYNFKYEGLECYMSLYLDTIQINSLMTDVESIDDWIDGYIYKLANRISAQSELTKLVILGGRVFAVTRFLLTASESPNFRWEFLSYLCKMKSTIDLFNQTLGNDLH